jgi:WD40 repeat protein
MSLQNQRQAGSILALLFGAAIATAAQTGAGRGEVVKAAGKQLKAHGGELRDLEVSPDGRVLASGGDDKTVKLWSLPAGELLHTLTGHTKLITDVEFTPDSRLVAAASEDRSISVWSVADGKRLALLTGHTEWVSTIRFAPDGRLLVSRAANEWRTWSVPDATPGAVRQIDGSGLAKSLMTADGGTIAVGLAQGVALLSLPDLKQVALLEMGSVHALAITPDGQTLAAAGRDGLVLWSLAQRQRIGAAANVTGVNVLSVTPDGKMLASGEASGAVRTWSLLDGRQVSVMTGHQGAVGALAISPDGRHVVSGSSDSTARLWSVADGAPIATLEGHRGSVDHVRVSADGTTVITGQESDFQITGATGGGIGMRKIKADAVIALWQLSPPAFRRYVGR